MGVWICCDGFYVAKGLPWRNGPLRGIRHRCLLEHGAQRSYQFKGKRCIVRRETTMLENIATVLGELGVDKTLIHEQPMEYFILLVER